MKDSNKDHNVRQINSEKKINPEELPTFQNIEIASDTENFDNIPDRTKSMLLTSPVQKIPEKLDFSRSVHTLKRGIDIYNNYSPTSTYSNKKQINLQHVIKGNKNLNIVILDPNSPKNSPLAKHASLPIEREKFRQIENFDKNSVSIQGREEIGDRSMNNHSFYTSGRNTFNKLKNLKEKILLCEKNILSDSTVMINKEEFSEKSISENEIKPRLSMYDNNEDTIKKRILRKLTENNFLARDIVKDDISELIQIREHEKKNDKEANGIITCDKNLENVKVTGLGGPATFNFDPKQKRRYKRKDLNKGKLYFKYRYVTEKLIETNNLGEEKQNLPKFLDNKDSNIVDNTPLNDETNNCYFYSSDDKNVIKFTCLFLRKIEKAIFIFNMKKYYESLNYLKESKIIKNEEEFAEILLTFSGFDKYTIGEFLSKEKSPNENNKITKYFISVMDFEGEYFLDSFRYLLAHINLPKDSGLILNLIDVFSEAYFKDNITKEQIFVDVTAVYLMASTILAINTIFHNVKVSNSNMQVISKEDFKKMNKGVKADLVELIYDEIKANKLDIIHDYNELIYRKLEVKSEEILG